MEEDSLLPENPTGFPTQEEKDTTDLRQCEEVLRKEKQLLILKSTDGWKILEDFLKNVTNSFIEQLKTEEDFNKIRKIQSLIVALEFLPGVIDQVFFEATRAKEYLQRFINDDLAPRIHEG